ncbi:MAG: type II toxin-antitoxin system RelE/ParE family toxin [Bacteroidota bacterium]
MNYKITTVPKFDKQAKRLSKKYISLKQELQNLFTLLETEPIQGTSIGKNCYKIRLPIASKGKGKSGGARVITHVYVLETTVYLLAIYDKAEQENIQPEEINNLLSSIK